MKVMLGNLPIDRNEVSVRHHADFTIEPIDGKDAVKCMDEGIAVLRGLGINHWISSGNLLGIYRDDNLISHDTDIDVNVLMEYDTFESNKLSGEVIRKMASAGFDLIRSAIYNNHFMQTAFMHKEAQVIFDIYYFYSGVVPGVAFNVSAEGLIKKPMRFLVGLDTVLFEGTEYPCPDPIEDFLEWRFGKDWMKPKKYKKAWQDEATHLEKWHA